MDSNFAMASFVGVPLSKNGVFGCGCFKTSLKSSNTSVSLSSDEIFGIYISFEKNYSVSDILVACVSGT